MLPIVCIAYLACLLFAMLTHSLLYMPTQFAVSKYKSPIAFYEYLVSFSNITSILSNRTDNIEIITSQKLEW